MKVWYKAFTLIELLIVIVIIGILATAIIPKVKGMQDRAKYTVLNKYFQDFRAAVFMAESNTNKTLDKITGRSCTHCSCMQSWSYSGINLKSLPSNHPCRTDWISALRKIEAAADMTSWSLSAMETDPRGSPYMFDENESPGCIWAQKDYIRSMGPDGYYRLHNPSQPHDDRGLSIPPYWCDWAY